MVAVGQTSVQLTKWACIYSPSLLLWVWQQQNCGEGLLRVDRKRGHRGRFQPLVFGERSSALSLSDPGLKTAEQLSEPLKKYTVYLQGQTIGARFGVYFWIYFFFFIAIVWQSGQFRCLCSGKTKLLRTYEPRFGKVSPAKEVLHPTESSNWLVAQACPPSSYCNCSVFQIKIFPKTVHVFPSQNLQHNPTGLETCFGWFQCHRNTSTLQLALQDNRLLGCYVGQVLCYDGCKNTTGLADQYEKVS